MRVGLRHDQLPSTVTVVGPLPAVILAGLKVDVALVGPPATARPTFAPNAVEMPGASQERKNCERM
jgi:hypothetical protein